MSGAPIALSYNDPLVEDIIELLRRTGRENRIVYYGFRPRDSFELHKTISASSAYEFRAASLLQNKYDAWRKSSEETNDDMRVHPGRATTRTDPGAFLDFPLVFDSCFESGNLDLAVRVHKHIDSSSSCP